MSLTTEQFQTLSNRCQTSAVGKQLPNALYVHKTALTALDPLLQDYEQQARNTNPQIENATLVKFNTDQPTISYLFYPDFDSDPHPALDASIQVNLQTREVRYRDYSTSDNPPILHRKETFVLPDYPQYETFAHLTRIEEALGLLNNSRFIGTKREWQQRLDFHGVQLHGHELHQHQEEIKAPPIRIERHKAAMVRKALSRPVRAALEAELFSPETTFFDYGCGYGGDMERVAVKGYVSNGWDPYYLPNTPLLAADIVNLGYIINVIEDLAERREALVKAWELTKQVLVVAAQVLIHDNQAGQLAYGDGVITRRNTFQKYYEQEELKTYIDQVLEVDAVPVALGIYFVFRDAEAAETFRASRFQSRATTPRVCRKVRKFEDYAEMLQPVMDFITKRGRLPVKGELAQEAEILGEFRSYRQAYKLILEATDEQEWEAIADQRREDLKLYLALTRFGERPRAHHFSKPVKQDFKALFGSYKKACLFADMMLMTVGDLENIADLCDASPVGQRRNNSFWVHINALETLDPLIRLYEGCASRTIGRLDQVTVIKFHLTKPCISYLYYPNFDDEPHPEFHTGMKIDLRDLGVYYWEANPNNPPILHEKEKLVTPDYPNYEKLVKLSKQERDWGLLDDMTSIRKRRGWLRCLEDHCATIKHHRLYWRKDCDPYKLKLLQASVRTRKARQKT
ncbi:MAG: DNA phosphorothioation-associated putative methyltransferase [Kamptonema sp. SIO4C4]|nr:DNA phosphorothioation-associated putative methyltransferase [Kamptonema sp. SIO4C4]